MRRLAALSMRDLSPPGSGRPAFHASPASGDRGRGRGSLMRRTIFVVLALACVLAVLLAVGVASGADTTPPTTIYAAVSSSNGLLRILPGKDAKIYKGEYMLSWNQIGPAGATGAQGETGPSGPRGPQGETGPQARPERRARQARVTEGTAGRDRTEWRERTPGRDRPEWTDWTAGRDRTHRTQGRQGRSRCRSRGPD